MLRQLAKRRSYLRNALDVVILCPLLGSWACVGDGWMFFSGWLMVLLCFLVHFE